MVILPAILRHLCFHISNRDDLIDKCLDAMGSIVSILHDQESVMLSQLVGGVPAVGKVILEAGPCIQGREL